ncbi:MAG: HAD-IIB family hydrolase [Thermodesulfobacteriota bacterium]
MSSQSGLYLQLFSIHGLIRGNSPQLGYDADTGGQVKYVLELARALGNHPEVGQVDLVTRLIEEKNLAPIYAAPTEEIGRNVRIVRIQCGGRKYIRKELLWPHLDEFIDKTLKMIKAQGRVPDLFHGHYPDAGYVAMELAEAFNRPFLFTGHSLGRNKMAKLLESGLSSAEVDRRYKIEHRIAVEEEIIDKADLIITSTSQEISEQYGLYHHAAGKNFSVIPPGIDLETFYPYYHNHISPRDQDETCRHIRMTILKELQRFWTDPGKPFILALCRPDQRKNIGGLIDAYGTDADLRAMANLAIFAGIRKDIASMEDNERNVLTDMLLRMDYYDLYGKLAIPKKHDFATEVPELYRLCADSGGIFVNPAMVEPFGLTLIEASACGLPIVATNDGGPVDIVANCRNGTLVDVTNPARIAAAIKELLVDQKKWEACSRSGIIGVGAHYSWASHCEHTIEQIRPLLPAGTARPPATPSRLPTTEPFGRRLTAVSKLLITDIDNTLEGDSDSLQRLLALLHQHRTTLAWGVSTGRSLELTLDIMTTHHIPIPDVLICSVGTEIYYGPNLRIDKGWQQHISHRWKPEDIKKTLGDLDFLALQPDEGQRRCKISYYMGDRQDLLELVRQRLGHAGLPCTVIYSHGRFLDILPQRASKGKAIKYLKYKWEFAADDIMVAGDSGNDEDMLRSGCSALVVANHSRELDHLRGHRRIFFSKERHAAGIIDGLVHFQFL